MDAIIHASTGPFFVVMDIYFCASWMHRRKVIPYLCICLLNISR